VVFHSISICKFKWFNS